MPAFQPLLLLLITANSTPVLMRRLLGHRCKQAIDGGHCLADGRPVFGPSKTWTGLIAGIVLTGAVAALLGFSFAMGLATGAAAMAGDLLSSFLKRRLGLASSRPAPGLDQLPESLFPALLAAAPLGLDGRDILFAVTLFLILDLASAHLLYRSACGNIRCDRRSRRQPRRSRCSVTSGRLLRRTSTTEEPAPAEV